MITRRFAFQTVVIALLVFFSAQTYADDTEIYVGDAATANGAVLPNVLFILDTSGSMTNTDGGSTTRLDRMKEALRTIISSSHNVRMGLMRFHKEGGPVLYPVSDINEAVAESGSGSDLITYNMASANDDAEESSGGGVTLNNPQLFLVNRPSGGGASLEIRVNTGNDDAEENVSSGSVSLDSTDLELTDDRNANQAPGTNQQVIGVRFQNVTIPVGATIISASLQFEIDETKDLNDPLTIRIYGQNSSNAATFSNTGGDISGRPKTSTYVDWAAETGLGVNDPLETDDLRNVVQEIVNGGSWSSGNAMAFILQYVSGSGIRTVESYNGETGAAPLLKVTYTLGVSTDLQTVGLRFQNVMVPQGVTVTNAHLEFTSAANSTGTVLYTITGENSDNAAAFTTASNDITGRADTAASVNWNVNTDWALNTGYSSPDLTTVVQEIVNRSGWCGGNAMAFTVTSPNSNNRIAYSYDGASADAPRLVIEYDEDTIATDACVVQTSSTQVISGSDDVEEQNSGSVYIDSSDLELIRDTGSNTNQTIGIRFRNIPIPKDATILEADITFTTDEATSTATSLTVKGEDIDDSPPFSTDPHDVTDRTTTTAAVSWAPAAWNTVGEQHATPDLASIVSEITSRSGWEAGNNMTFIISGSGTRTAESYEGDPASSAVLRIKVEGQLSTGVLTVRDRLIEIVDGLNYKSGTPILDTLYEAARYWRGEGVHYGKTRGFGYQLGDSSFGESDPSRSEYTRLSHPASYTGGTVVQPAGCTDDNPNDTDCIYEYISGSATYISPIEEWCQSNYQILLSDGNGYGTQSVSLVNSMLTTGYSCNNDHDQCSIELTEFLHQEDQNSLLEQTQAITTYTIGFNLQGTDPTFLTNVATAGGGTFETASSAGDLADVFQSILSDILSQSTSFAAPAVSVNAFNKLYHDNDIYFSLFLPKREVRWPGNLKKYNICQGNYDDTCTFGEIIDADGNPALTANGTFEPNSRSIWSSADDGNEVQEGGAGEEVPANPGRKIYTYVGASAPSNSNLYLITETTETDAASLTGDALTLRGLLDGTSLTNLEYSNLIYWILGRDIEDENDNSVYTDDRWSLGDSLHGTPLIVTYGKDNADNPVKKIFMGTNDGGIHMINAETGEEEWVFMPQALLDAQVDLKNNNAGNHIYGIDGTITSWVHDVNENGIIEYAEGDRVWIFFGMRRGGRNIYALDVTPTSVLASPTATGGIVPKLKWRIEGGVAGDDFELLGETWSSPEVTTVRSYNGTLDKAEITEVLIFGGGYHPDQDTKFGSSSYGNAVYVVEAETGDLLWWAGPASSGADLELANMVYPIPSSVATLDTNLDGHTDTLYVGDTGGQIWHIYIGANFQTDVGGGRLAVVSSDTDGNRRKFFYRPDVAKVTDSIFSATADYDLVTITSGDRANPVDTDVHDQVYAFRNYTTSGALPVSWTPLTQSDLYPATANLIQNADNTYSTAQTDLLRAADGWYINLQEDSGDWIGEKGLARTLIMDGKLFFTTFVPGSNASPGDPCSIPLGGSGRFYAVDVLNAAAVYPNWDGNSDNYTKDDRTYDISLPGIPSEPVPIFQKNGITIIVGGGGGGFVFDPDTPLPQVQTFWYQEE